MSYQNLLSELNSMKQVKTHFNSFSQPLLTKLLTDIKVQMAIPEEFIVQCHKKTGAPCSALGDCFSTHGGATTLNIEIILDTDKIPVNFAVRKTQESALALEVNTCDAVEVFTFLNVSKSEEIQDMDFSPVCLFIEESIIFKYKKLSQLYNLSTI